MNNFSTWQKLIIDYWKKPLPKIISRDLDVPINLPIKRAITILGPRRAGKSFLLLSLIKKLQARKIPKERTLYLNFEEMPLSLLSFQNLPEILETFYSLRPENKQKKVYLFFDEIQNIVGWESFIRTVVERENAQIFLSGSSSKLLSQEIATSMRGRTLAYHILPFSFSEFLRAKKTAFSLPLSSPEKAKILSLLRAYLSCGGYPEVIFDSDHKEKILKEIIEVTIYRDIIERHGIRNIKAVKLMFDALIHAKQFSLQKFFSFLKSYGLKVSKNSLHNYLLYFQDAFIFYSLRDFSFSSRASELSTPKVYSVDNGLIDYFLHEDYGKKFENLVFLSLLRRGFLPGESLFYFQNRAMEVDFLLKKPRHRPQLIQACFDIRSYDTRQREIISLAKAAQKLNIKDNLYILTWDEEGEEKILGKTVSFIPLWKWLLEEK